jgi:hypothetical protein
MPQKVINESGEEIEVPTTDEVEAAKEEAADKARQEAEESFNNERADHEAETKALEAKIEAEQSKQQSLSGLRHMTKAKEAELEASKKTQEDLQKQLQDKQKELSEFVVGGTKREIFSNLTGDDKELLKAAEESYALLQTMSESSKEAVEERVKSALAIARSKLGRPEPTDAIQTASSYGGSGRAVRGATKDSVNPELKDLGARHFGLTDEHWSKHKNAPISQTK